MELTLPSQNQAPNRRGSSCLEDGGASGKSAAGGGKVIHQNHCPLVHLTIAPKAVLYVLPAVIPGSVDLGRGVPGADQQPLVDL